MLCAISDINALTVHRCSRKQTIKKESSLLLKFEELFFQQVTPAWRDINIHAKLGDIEVFK